MQGRRGRDGLLDFDSFSGFSEFGGFGGHRSLMSSFFGGKNPFDDPFFTQPMGNMFGSEFFGPHGSPFANAPQAGSIEQHESQLNKRNGLVIEELSSDDEDLDNGGTSKTKDNPKKHSMVNKEPYVEIPDDEVNGGTNKHIQRREFGNRMKNAQPRSQIYTFKSSSVSYSAEDGAYYTKSMTKRAGSDGVVFEEFKEADSSTGQANHRISRGLHNKGDTLSRKLGSDGNVDTTQMLHNLNEGELDSFEQAWEGSSGRHLTGGRQRLEGGNHGANNSVQASRGGWALPSTQRSENPGRSGAHMQHTGRKATDCGPRGRAWA